ncbi:MAG: Asp-tRNA(Asn)/Glu-tRNA(Gln) amidotransferase subunit GatC [Clostridium sp.]|nr:Asp-tRNA(Asn)/Glu-tRNA(Gln) amidotransferase subunit GatC [Clostridium sp.]
MSVSKQDVEYIAKLAKLKFTESEKNDLINDLNKIINYMDKLNEVNTDDVDIIINPCEIESRYREDLVCESSELDNFIEDSPKSLGEFIVVPRIID